MRGLEMTRLEVFIDAAFAFAVQSEVRPSHETRAVIQVVKNAAPVEVQSIVEQPEMPTSPNVRQPPASMTTAQPIRTDRTTAP